MFEACAHSIMLFLGLPVLSPYLSILILSGVVLFQLPIDILVDIHSECTNSKSKNGYSLLNDSSMQPPKKKKKMFYFCVIIKSISFALQLSGLIMLFVVLYEQLDSDVHLCFTLALAFSLCTISIIWTSPFQKLIAMPEENGRDTESTPSGRSQDTDSTQSGRSQETDSTPSGSSQDTDSTSSGRSQDTDSRADAGSAEDQCSTGNADHTQSTCCTKIIKTFLTCKLLLIAGKARISKIYHCVVEDSTLSARYKLCKY